MSDNKTTFPLQRDNTRPMEHVAELVGLSCIAQRSTYVALLNFI
jgi:hypothetical protein